jgi:hypothetical protein
VEKTSHIGGGVAIHWGAMVDFLGTVSARRASGLGREPSPFATTVVSEI